MTVAIVLFAIIILISLGIAVAARTGHATNIEEYIVGGRSFSSFLFFFLAVGEIYSIGTLVGLPGAIYTKGASYALWFMGYILLAYPISYVLAPYFWRAAKHYHALTLPEVFGAHYASRSLEVVGTLVIFMFLVPWAELQYLGLEASFRGLGITVTPTVAVIAAAVIAGIYIVFSGVRSPALISILKDALLFLTIIVVGLIAISHYGGVGQVFKDVAAIKPALLVTRGEHNTTFVITTIVLQSFGFIALSSAYVLTGKSARAVKRAYVFMPLYMLMYPFLVIVAYVAVTSVAGIKNPNFALFAIAVKLLPHWAIGIVAAAAALSAFLVLAGSGLTFGALFARNVTPRLAPAAQRQLTRVVTGLYLAAGAALTLLAPQLMLNVITVAYDFATQLIVPLLGLIFVRGCRGGAYAIGLLVGSAVAGVLAVMQVNTLGISYGLIGVAANVIAVWIANEALTRMQPRAADAAPKPVGTWPDSASAAPTGSAGSAH